MRSPLGVRIRVEMVREGKECVTFKSTYQDTLMRIQFHLPEGLRVGEFELSMLFAAKLFEEGLITSGQGAKMVGLSKQAFVELLGKYQLAAPPSHKTFIARVD